MKGWLKASVIIISILIITIGMVCSDACGIREAGCPSIGMIPGGSSTGGTWGLGCDCD